VTLTITLQNYPTIKLQKQFKVTVICQNLSFSFSQVVADLSYDIGQGALTTGEFATQQAPLCQHPVSYSAQYKKDLTPTTKPSFIKFDPSSDKDFTIDTVSAADAGVYKVILTATLVDFDSTQKSTSFETTLTLVDTCPTTIIKPSPINDMTATVNGGQIDQQLPSFTDSQSSSHGDKYGLTLCGPKTFTISPSNLSFFSLTGSTLSLKSTNPADVGSQVVTLTITLQNYPTIKLQKIFHISINCQNQSFSFSQVVADLSYDIGQGALTTSEFATQQAPLCQHPVSYSA
jgi:hypothetical protein